MIELVFNWQYQLYEEISHPIFQNFMWESFPPLLGKVLLSFVGRISLIYMAYFFTYVKADVLGDCSVSINRFCYFLQQLNQPENF